MKVAVTGAGGFIGQALVSALLERRDAVIALGRSPESMTFSADVEKRQYDPNDPQPRPELFEGVDAVIHLAGETVAGRWNDAKKREIRTSRSAGTRNLIESLAACTARPSVVLSASAVGYYGARGDEPLFESSRPGTDFLAQTCIDWEAPLKTAESLGLRTATLRTGIVLGNGGALRAMLPPFKFGVGGPFGSGRQFVPWIHIDDLVALYLFALDHDVRGPVNAVTPDYTTSARFAQALGAALRRPALAPAPGFALRAVLGEFATTILASQLVIPAVAQDAGFTWRHSLLEEAMAHALGSPLTSPYGVTTFESALRVSAPLDEVFAYFSNPRNLERLTPSTLRFAFTSCPQTVERGSRMSYRLRVHGVPMTWETLIARWEAPWCFVDVQLHGPYALWEHEHRFEPADGGDTMLFDRVRYLLPFAPFGNLAAPFVKRDVENIFAFRREAAQAQFAR